MRARVREKKKTPKERSASVLHFSSQSSQDLVHSKGGEKVPAFQPSRDAATISTRRPPPPQALKGWSLFNYFLPEMKVVVMRGAVVEERVV